MGQVKRTVVMHYGNDEFEFEPTNKLIRSIDAGMAPMTCYGVLGCMEVNQLPIPHLAYMLSRFIDAGGGDIDEDQVRVDLDHDMMTNGGKGIMALLEDIAPIFQAPDGAAKNSLAPSPLGGKTKAKGKQAKK